MHAPIPIWNFPNHKDRSYIFNVLISVDSTNVNAAKGLSSKKVKGVDVNCIAQANKI